MSTQDVPTTPTDFRGVWYGCGRENTLPNRDYVYAGGKATYSAWHRPMAVYAPKVNRTFFVFGDDENRPAISYYDHEARTFARPLALGTNPDGNAHRNPTVLIDETGTLFVFYGYHALEQPIHALRSKAPYDISSWTRCANVTDRDGSYPQPWQLKPGEIAVAHRQPSGWCLKTSTDGCESWGPTVCLASFDNFEFLSTVYGATVAASGPYPRSLHFTWSKLGGGSVTAKDTKPLWARRYNVYYARSDDGGATWRRSDGTPYVLPVTEDTAEKVHDSGDHGVWIKDIQLDAEGCPCILFLDADIDTYVNTWKVARHAKEGWTVSDVTTSDHMYDGGALVLRGLDDFRVYGPSAPVQAQMDGGEIEEWTSRDQGRTWSKTAALTRNSTYSHNHVKTVYNHQESDGQFRAFWSYGDAQSPPDTEVVTMFFYGEALGRPGVIRQG